MAENKKSFILYVDLLHTVSKLPDETAGKLLKIILEYVNDNNPVIDDFVLELVFEPIKQQLKRDLKDWEEIKIHRAISGHLGGVNSGLSRQSKQTKQLLQKRSKPKQTKQTKQTEANEAVNVNDTVNVNVSGSVIESPPPQNLQENKMPKIEEVQEVFIRNGGTLEMARRFFDSNSSTGWINNRNLPIINFHHLVYKYIENWRKFERKDAPVVELYEVRKCQEDNTRKFLDQFK